VSSGEGRDADNKRLFLNDAHAFSLSTSTWSPLTAAPFTPRYGAAGGILASREALIITHGFARTRYQDTWMLDLTTDKWTDITPGGSNGEGNILKYVIENCIDN
jgi:hypothetical protein